MRANNFPVQILQRIDHVGQQNSSWFESDFCERCFMKQTIIFLLFKLNFVPASLSIVLGCDVKLTGDLEL